MKFFSNQRGSIVLQWCRRRCRHPSCICTCTSVEKEQNMNEEKKRKSRINFAFSFFFCWCLDTEVIRQIYLLFRTSDVSANVEQVDDSICSMKMFNEKTHNSLVTGLNLAVFDFSMAIHLWWPAWLHRNVHKHEWSMSKMINLPR